MTSEWCSSRIAINEVTKVSTCPDITHLAAGGRARREIGYVIKGKAERGSVRRLVHQHDSDLQERRRYSTHPLRQHSDEG